MQSSSQNKQKCSALFSELISKITRLRKKLVSCGYSIKQVTEIIFIQFLKIPKIDWKNIQQTNNFYEVKSHFKVDASSTQMIMRLQKIVPNLQTVQVCQYLLTVLELNASDFDINLGESSSDSNDSSAGMNRLLIKRPKRRIKNSIKRDQCNQKLDKIQYKGQLPLKKTHKDSQYYRNKKKQQQVNKFFKNRPIQHLLPLQDQQLQKQMKKIPESEDSEHQ